MTASAVFEEHQGLLKAVAYRVLGRFTDAEDIVQEAWLRWNSVDQETVEDPEAYLVRVTTRLAIDRLRSAQVRHETYVGPWLPEPMLTSPDVAENVALSESVSTAMLLVLETLTPLERAVFVLREAFGYSHAEIASILERSEESVRQTATRARTHVAASSRRYDSDIVTRRRATEAFMQACAGGDVSALMAILAPDVTMVADGGGLAPAPRKAIHGFEHVARALVVFAGRVSPDQRIVLVDINGGPALAVYEGQTPVAAVVPHLVDGLIETLHLISNPTKLAGLNL